jgi:hypothetical protein
MFFSYFYCFEFELKRLGNFNMNDLFEIWLKVGLTLKNNFIRKNK